MPQQNLRANRFKTRRARNLSLLVLALISLLLFVFVQKQSLGRSDFSTGYVMFGCLVFLAAFHWRKRLTFLPQLGTSSFWMQLHIYVGLGSVGVFLMHIGWRIPQGGFEIFLALLYLVVAGSGIFGLYVTRTIPRKLTQTRIEPFFESIPRLRNQIAQRAKSIIEQNDENDHVLVNLFRKQLQPFFTRRRRLAYLLAPSAREARQLVASIQNSRRYLAADDHDWTEQLCQLVREKDDLDYHRVMQGRLKYWLLLHVSLTYSLLIVASVHGIMAHAFAGGAA